MRRGRGDKFKKRDRKFDRAGGYSFFLGTGTTATLRRGEAGGIHGVGQTML